jgi:hypothetical protein
MVPFIQTTSGINLVMAGKPVAVSAHDKHFDAVVEALKSGAGEEDIHAILAAELTRVTEATKLTDDLEVKGGALFYQGDELHGTLADRILKMLDEGFNLTPMVKFLENLMTNPSHRVVSQLYAFLEKGQNAITEDGHFLAYKAVRADFLDIHSGTMDNSVGRVVEMPRRKVDEDPNRTCSHGLHVCSFDYLPNFAHANGHIVICKVNPADVVAIPADYNDTKMRVCRYEVVGEYEGYYTAASDVLGSTSVLDGTGSEEDFPFRVDVIRSEGGHPEPAGNFATLTEAASHADDMLTDRDVFEVVLTNRRTNFEVDRRQNPDFDDSDTGGDDDGFAPRFEVRVYRTDADLMAGQFETFDSYDDVADAKAAAVDLEVPYVKVRVVDMVDGEVMLSLSRD